MSFNIGDTVACVDARSGPGILRVGQTYEVRDITRIGFALMLEGVSGAFRADDFRIAKGVRPGHYGAQGDLGHIIDDFGITSRPMTATEVRLKQEENRKRINGMAATSISFDEWDALNAMARKVIAADRLDALQHAAAADPSAENDKNDENAREFREILGGRRRVPHDHKSTNYPYPPENETLARAIDITAATAEHPQAMWRVDR